MSIRAKPLLLAMLGACSAHGALAQDMPARIIVQSSPLAGFRHYEAPNLWGEVRSGDELALVREPDNPHDRNAVRVEWRSLKLGYVPRAQNAAVARMLDRGTRLVARVSKVQHTRAPNRRIEFEIFIPV
ncbi:MAG: HIRAN domain-containing protein [Burkholderiales bacterium]|nr:HIRAN domain-containing protein [Burkholderiales bacterium]